ncbi:MAG: hypothetical protein ACYDH3_02690 [Candidatus Aminicenantales bacterium]
MEKKMISIWFFIGLLLTVYGALTFGAGIYDLIVPYKHNVVLRELHAGVWWGALLIVIGVVYIVKFKPKKIEK